MFCCGRKNLKDATKKTVSQSLIIISIIIERRDYGGVLSEDCEDTEQSSEKVSKRA